MTAKPRIRVRVGRDGMIAFPAARSGDWAKPVLTGVGAGSGPYKAARPDRILGGWGRFGAGQASSEAVRMSLRGLVAHARYAARNHDYFRAWLLAVVRNVVGPEGLQLRLDVKDADGKPDRAAIDAVRAAWRRWGAQGSPTVCGRHSLQSLQAVATRAVARDGQVMVRHWRGREHGSFAYRVQLLTVDMLDIDYSARLSDGGRIMGGVELDRFDKPVALHMWKENPGLQVRHGGGRRRMRVPVADVILLSLPTDPDQVLAEPWSHASLRRLSQVEDFEDNVLAQSRHAARTVGTMERATPAELYDPSVDPGDAPKDDADEIVDYGPNWIELPEGVSAKPFDHKFPDAVVEPFVRQQLLGGAAGLGLSYSSLTGDLRGANFSSLRAGLGAERDEWKMLQAWLGACLMGPIFAEWIGLALLSGQVEGYSGRDLARLDRASWRGRGWPAVNPREEVQSDNLAMEAGTLSPQEVVARRGRDLDDVLAERAEALALAEAHGVTIGPPPKPLALPAPATAAEGETDETETEEGGDDAKKPE